MEVHKPRPIHNWRDLAIEVAVIVVGIVIALSAEQFIQGLEWRHKLSRSEEQMRLEMTKDDGPQVVQRLAASECIRFRFLTVSRSANSSMPRICT